MYCEDVDLSWRRARERIFQQWLRRRWPITTWRSAPQHHTRAQVRRSAALTWWKYGNRRFEQRWWESISPWGSADAAPPPTEPLGVPPPWRTSDLPAVRGGPLVTTPALLLASHLLAAAVPTPGCCSSGACRAWRPRSWSAVPEVLEEAGDGGGEAFQPHSSCSSERASRRLRRGGALARWWSRPRRHVFLQVWNEGAAQELLGVLLGRRRHRAHWGCGRAAVARLLWPGARGAAAAVLRGGAPPAPAETLSSSSVPCCISSRRSLGDQFLHVARWGALAVPASPEAAPSRSRAAPAPVLWAGSEGAGPELDRALLARLPEPDSVRAHPGRRTATPAALSIPSRSLLERHRGLAGFESRLVMARSRPRGCSTAVSPLLGGGEYLVPDPGNQSIYPDHYRRLVAALGAGQAA